MIVLPSALAPLSTMPHWLLWKWETNGSSRTKVPYQVNGHHASTNKPQTWTTFDAVKAANKFDGVGFVLTDSGFAGFDIDDCRDPNTGAVHPWADALVERVNSYTEITPSETGLRIFGKTEEPPFKMGKVMVADGVGCEIFRQQGYITITGNVYRDAPLVNMDELSIPSSWSCRVRRASAQSREMMRAMIQRRLKLPSLSSLPISVALTGSPSVAPYPMSWARWVRIVG